MRKLMVMMVLLTAVVTGTMAQKPAVVLNDKAGWHKIGEIRADLKVDKDAIIVMGADKFKALKLKVTDAPINIYDVQVHYESGDQENIEVRQDLKVGEETRVLDLKGYERELKKVVFVYKTSPNRKDEKAHVELYGLK